MDLHVERRPSRVSLGLHQQKEGRRCEKRTEGFHPLYTFTHHTPDKRTKNQRLSEREKHSPACNLYVQQGTRQAQLLTELTGD